MLLRGFAIVCWLVSAWQCLLGFGQSTVHLLFRSWSRLCRLPERRVSCFCAATPHMAQATSKPLARSKPSDKCIHGTRGTSEPTRQYTHSQWWGVPFVLTRFVLYCNSYSNRTRVLCKSLHGVASAPSRPCICEKIWAGPVHRSPPWRSNLVFNFS
jgi:hypothetical protein